MLTLTNSAAFERKQSCEKEISALSMTLTGNILLSKKEDIDTATEERDSLQDFLINYWIINEHECRGGVFLCVEGVKCHY